MIDAFQRSNQDLNRLFTITEVLTQHIRYQQMYIYMHTILAYLRDSLTYMRQVVIHMLDYVDAPFQLLTNPPPCITALYAKNDQAIGEQCSQSISLVPHTFIPIAITSNLWIISSNPKVLGSTIRIIYPDKATSTVPLWQPFCILMLFPAFRAASRYFHLLPHYEGHTMIMNVSLDTTNINVINFSVPDFKMWQHFNSNWTTSHLKNLANVPEDPVAQLYKHLINASESS